MATQPNGSSVTSNPKASSLRDKLASALPTGFTCNTRYVHTQAKTCEPLFSALPGQEPEKTRLASHFLSVSVSPEALSHLQGSGKVTSETISFAVEVLVYTSKRLTTIFVSKVDSTPFVPRIRPSPIKSAVTTFLQWLADEELRRHPRRKVVISLFARAQNQYLFPGSSDDKTKHVLDDRQLIRWWARVLDPIIPKSTSNDSRDNSSPQYQGYMTVPGSTDLRYFMPPSTTQPGKKPTWLPGNPLRELAWARGIPESAPPRCLLPRFPDDPKARYMSDLDDEIGISQESQVTVSPSKKKSGQWRSVRDLNLFWETMGFRQECSSGRMVGFLWLVISPKASDDQEPPTNSFSGDSQDSIVALGAIPTSDSFATPEPDRPSQASLRKKQRRKPLTGPIIARQPRLKGGSSGLSNSSELLDLVNGQSAEAAIVSKEGYDKAMQTLLQLDFSNLEVAARSTTKWCRELYAIAGLSHDCAMRIDGTAKVEQPAAVGISNGAPAVNDLGGMIKKKRKAVDAPVSEAEVTPAVNVLAAGMIRKKPKPAS